MNHICNFCNTEFTTKKKLNFKSKNNLPITTEKIEFLIQNFKQGTHRCIFAGEYPPSNSNSLKQHDNVTSKSINKQIGPNFDWIDLLPLSPNTNSTDIDRKHMFSIVTDDMIDCWFVRLSKRIQESYNAQNFLPLLYICGNELQNIWNNNFKNRFEFIKIIDEQIGLKLFSISDIQFLIKLLYLNPYIHS